jgi:hypothetical protein
MSVAVPDPEGGDSCLMLGGSFALATVVFEDADFVDFRVADCVAGVGLRI